MDRSCQNGWYAGGRGGLIPTTIPPVHRSFKERYIYTVACSEVVHSNIPVKERENGVGGKDVKPGSSCIRSACVCV